MALCVLILLLATISHADAYILPNRTHIDTNLKLTWQQAQDYCLQTYGTYLASIHDENAQEQIFALISESSAGYASFWIGLTNVDGEDASHYHWSDGSIFDWGDRFGRSPWANNKPNKQAQDYIFLDSEYDLRWNDGHSDMKLFWVCNSPANESSELSSTNYESWEPSTNDIFYAQSERKSVPNLTVHIIIVVLVGAIGCMCVVYVTALYIRKQYRSYMLSYALETQTVFSESNGDSRRSTAVYECRVLSPLSNHIAMTMNTNASSYVVAARGEIVHWTGDEEDDEEIERMYDTMEGDDLSSDTQHTLLDPNETVEKGEMTVLVHEDFGNVVNQNNLSM